VIMLNKFWNKYRETLTPIGWVAGGALIAYPNRDTYEISYVSFYLLFSVLLLGISLFLIQLIYDLFKKK